MNKTPKSFRIQIGIFGKCNVGKSSVINAITRQEISIVSDYSGTTTDPVEKGMEIQPIGPVVFIDTSGIDDETSLGKLRINKTRKVVERIDVAIIVLDPILLFTEYEDKLFKEFVKKNIPTVILINKIDLCKENDIKNIAKFKLNFFKSNSFEKHSIIGISALKKDGIKSLINSIVELSKNITSHEAKILDNIITKNSIVLLVTPIDKEAPRGRLIMPQVYTIRNILDNDACCIIVKEDQLKFIANNINIIPKIVISDSSCLLEVSKLIPENWPLTTFSILFSNFYGTLDNQIIDILKLKKIRKGEKILICEACTHHPIGNDIGRKQIPNMINKFLGYELEYKILAGKNFISCGDLENYKMVIHCGGCMLNKIELKSRMESCKYRNIPFVNFGLIFSYVNNLFQRTLLPFEIYIS